MIDPTKVRSWQDACGKCDSCGMDMDMDPYCVQVDVLALRTAETGRDYPLGLDVNPAWRLCQGQFHTPRRKR